MAKSELTAERRRKAHHYYISENVALSQVRDEAQRRAFDKRKAEDSVIHYHAYDDRGQLCANTQHDEYEAGKGLLKEEVASG